MKTRQEFNFKIAELLKEMPIGKLQLSTKHNFAEMFEVMAGVYSQQRAGQIICNYICPDYRSLESCTNTKLIMDSLFPISMDPFFEESSETYKRLSNS